MLWKTIFALTIGARKWLAKAPYVLEKFGSNYRRMCQFLMTYGRRLGDLKGETIGELTNRRIFKVFNNLIYFEKDGFVHSYNILTKQTKKTSIKTPKDDAGLFVSRYMTEVVVEDQRRKLKVYDLERDQLVQTYEDYAGIVPKSPARKCWYYRR